MPIEMSCPFCQKSYRLKDELAGKKVTCANVACRRAFQVPGTAQTAALPPGAKPSSPPAQKASAGKSATKGPTPEEEAAALAALNDDPANAPQEVEMKCAACDHQWTVGLDMQGKNVLCPDCRHRQKVPVMKDHRRDWRVKEGAPSLAKQEKLEGVQASGDVSFVSGETLRKTGVIKEEFEPRPLKFWFLVIGVPIVAIGIVVAGFVNWRTTRKDNLLEEFMTQALVELDESKELPTADAPLFRSVMRLAAGEFSIQRQDPAGLKDALNHFAKSRQELDTVPPNVARDFLLSQLATTQLLLGGDSAQIDQQTRIRWTPAPAGTSRARLNEKTFDVQAEVLAVLKVLRREDRPAPADARLFTIRRLAREAVAQNQPELVDSLITGTTFFDTELNEARCYAAAEIAHATGQPDKAVELANNLKPQIQGLGPIAFQAIGLSTDPPMAGVTFYKLPTSGDLQEAPRLTYTLANLLQKKPEEALKIANRGGANDGRARALALVAEWSDNPVPALEAARDLVNSIGKGPAISEFTLTRLAIQAGRANNAELLEQLLKGMKDERSRAWARGAAIEQMLRSATDKPAEETLIEIPQDPKDYQVGQAWGRLAIARQKARQTGQYGSDVLSNLERWGTGSFKPFGLAGLALGLQDRDRAGAKP